ncbi:MAG: hypothetical protein GAK43_00775 [Stenotrophomonas maltophilia]|nr:MAG: hypothetical protein GAK43_00775 [Stenotrophomonas maltophilia]
MLTLDRVLALSACLTFSGFLVLTLQVHNARPALEREYPAAETDRTTADPARE